MFRWNLKIGRWDEWPLYSIVVSENRKMFSFQKALIKSICFGMTHGPRKRTRTYLERVSGVLNHKEKCSNILDLATKFSWGSSGKTTPHTFFPRTRKGISLNFGLFLDLRSFRFMSGWKAKCLKATLTPNGNVYSSCHHFLDESYIPLHMVLKTVTQTVQIFTWCHLSQGKKGDEARNFASFLGLVSKSW